MKFIYMYPRLGRACFRLNITRLRIPTGRRQTSWLFYKRARGVKLESTVKQLQLVVSLESERLAVFSLAQPGKAVKVFYKSEYNCYVMLCYVMLCYVMLFYVYGMLCYVIS